jgi:hypothetical protein
LSARSNTRISVVAAAEQIRASGSARSGGPEQPNPGSL